MGAEEDYSLAGAPGEGSGGRFHFAENRGGPFNLSSVTTDMSLEINKLPSRISSKKKRRVTVEVSWSVAMSLRGEPLLLCGGGEPHTASAPHGRLAPPRPCSHRASYR